MRVEQLVIHRFRGVRAGSVLEFAEGVNVILGENGSGKSLLLRLLVALLQGDRVFLQQQDVDVELSLGVAELRVVCRLVTTPTSWRVVVRAADEAGAVEYAWGSAGGLRVKGDEKDRVPPVEWPATPLWFHPVPYGTLRGDTAAQGARVAGLASRLSLFDEHLGAWTQMRAQGVSMRRPPQTDDALPGWPVGEPSDEWSLGQKRVFSLMWHLGATPAVPLVADELTAGLHHGWVQECLDRLEDRQVFVAAQSPLLIDLLSFDDAQDVVRAFTVCRVVTDPEGRREWVWQKPSDGRAERVYASWMQGMSFVSEVLLREQMW
ncbi:hypothetical protein LBMAG42_35310 [Deltaproteobacteria bacterium]|nr:hypothetical protein LBMAG42_35310 [Deltaproteobacteria bacterium]